MSKFKKMIILVDSDEQCAEAQELLFSLGCRWTTSNTTTVRNVDSRVLYVLDEDTGFITWGVSGDLIDTDEREYITPLEDLIAYVEEQNTNSFSKSDLKTGMLVKLANRKEYIVLKDIYDRDHEIDILVSYEDETSWFYLNSFQDDLTYLEDNAPEWSINAVYKFSHPYGILKIADNSHRKLIWERPEPIPQTVEFGGQQYTEEEFKKLQDSVNTLAEKFGE